MTDEATAPTSRTALRRAVHRGRHDRATIDAILDAGLICHVGFALDGSPWVFPTAYTRIDDGLFLHGAVANFGLRAVVGGAEACVTVTVVDGLVLARSAFHHSMNYRSVMVFGRGAAVDDPAAKRQAMMAIVDHMVPGRAADTRPPTDDELRRTLVVRIPLDEASAKVRTGGPVEEPDDIGLAHWAGELPLALRPGEPVADVAAPGDADLAPPAYLSNWFTRLR
ncbi:MAG TPA: pyridoxamine 5'-phosphate oxidase family protein [Acidimicrobiales bacterium]|nr:pyridoxamine 5'-phosphate oxidase family protein [Acidimicrobiales bacterium]